MLSVAAKLESLSLPVGAPLAGEGELHIGIKLMTPAAPPKGARVALFCVPGGGVKKEYFDLPGYSFAQRMLAEGYAVVLLDPLGVGKSSRPREGFAITAEVAARALGVAAEQVKARLAASDFANGQPIVAIGVGHSAGAMLTALQQDLCRSFAALALLCFSTRGLPDVLNDAERASVGAPDMRAQIPALARARFQIPYPSLPGRTADSPAGRALASVATNMVSTLGLHAFMPGNVAVEAARLDAPLFIGVGENDMTGPADDLPKQFGGARDLKLVIAPGAGHHPFVASSATWFLDQIADWVAKIVGDLGATENGAVE
jgi:pimeloyl-ACP methyl ester carboxylesterase